MENPFLPLNKANKTDNKVQKVMEEFAAGKLHDAGGKVVTKHDQAIAIAISEAGKPKQPKNI